MKLGACDFRDVTQVQWLQHFDVRRCGRRGRCWLRHCLWTGSPCGGRVSSLIYNEYIRSKEIDQKEINQKREGGGVPTVLAIRGAEGLVMLTISWMARRSFSRWSGLLIPISRWISWSDNADMIAPLLTLARHAATYHAGIPSQSYTHTHIANRLVWKFMTCIYINCFIYLYLLCIMVEAVEQAWAHMALGTEMFPQLVMDLSRHQRKDSKAMEIASSSWQVERRCWESMGFKGWKDYQERRNARPGTLNSAWQFCIKSHTSVKSNVYANREFTQRRITMHLDCTSYV